MNNKVKIELECPECKSILQIEDTIDGKLQHRIDELEKELSEARMPARERDFVNFAVDLLKELSRRDDVGSEIFGILCYNYMRDHFEDVYEGYRAPRRCPYYRQVPSCNIRSMEFGELCCSKLGDEECEWKDALIQLGKWEWWKKSGKNIGPYF